MEWKNEYMRRSFFLSALLCCCASFAAEPEAGQSSKAQKSVVEFKNAKSDRCIGVDHASKEHGAYIKQFKCDKAENQKWIKEAVTGSTYFRFKNMKSNKCMGVDHGSSKPGANIRQFECDNKPNQQWQEVPDQPYFTLRNLDNSLNCIGVDHASKENDVQLKVFPCDGKENQKWKVRDVS